MSNNDQNTVSPGSSAPSPPVLTPTEFEALCKATFFHMGELRVKDITNILVKVNFDLSKIRDGPHHTTSAAVKAWQNMWIDSIADSDWLLDFVRDHVTSYEQTYWPQQSSTAYTPMLTGPYSTLPCPDALAFWEHPSRWSKDIFLKMFKCLGDALDLEKIWEDKVWNYHAFVLFSSIASVIWSDRVILERSFSQIHKLIETVIQVSFKNFIHNWPYKEQKPDGVPMLQAVDVGQEARHAIVEAIIERDRTRSIAIQVLQPAYQGSSNGSAR